jgi:hypothetical protein
LNDTIAKERAEGCIEVTTYILINSLATWTGCISWLTTKKQKWAILEVHGIQGVVNVSVKVIYKKWLNYIFFSSSWYMNLFQSWLPAIFSEGQFSSLLMKEAVVSWCPW